MTRFRQAFIMASYLLVLIFYLQVMFSHYIQLDTNVKAKNKKKKKNKEQCLNIYSLHNLHTRGRRANPPGPCAQRRVDAGEGWFQRTMRMVKISRGKIFPLPKYSPTGPAHYFGVLASTRQNQP